MTRRMIAAGFCLACFWLGAVEPTEKSLSINFAAGRQNAPNVSVVSGLGEYGVYPVVGDCWNNVSATAVTNLTGFVWSDGQAVEGVTFSCQGTYWSVTAKPEHNNIMSTFLDCWSKPTWVQVDGLTCANGLSGDCTLYIYYACDGGNTIWAPSVNGTRYTYANGVVVEGDAAWGSLAVSRTGQLIEGTDYMKLEHVRLTDEGVIRLETSGNSNATIRGPFAALQFVFRSPQIAVTCNEQAGDVRIDDGAAAPSVVKNVAMGELITSTVTAIPAHGYRFSRWTGDTSIITEGSASSATIAVSTDARRRLTAVFEPITPFTYALSVNFSGGRNGDTEYCPIVGSGTFGVVPVVGTCWNNITTRVTENRGNLKWNDAVVVRGVTESNVASFWSLGTSKGVDNLFYGYMDDNNRTTFAGLTRENGFPTNCTVYIYNSTDSKNLYFRPMTVNGTTYTFVDNAVKPGTTRWGSTTKAQNNVLELGGDYLRIDNVLIPESGTIEIAPYHTGFTAQTARGGVAAIQIVFDMSAEYAVRASCDPERGTVQFNDDPAGSAVEVVGSHNGAFQTTLRAIPAPGFVFSRWTGNTGVIVGSVEAAEVLVASQLPVRLTAVFVPDTMPFTATWIGEGERGNLADPANWRCLSSGGSVLANTLPGDRTDVTISGNVIFDWPEGQTLAFRSLKMNCTLMDDCDWRGFDARGFSGTVDVNGHVLAVDSLAGTGTITDSAAGETPGELRITVAEGQTVTNATMAITGGVRVVKDGAGLFVAAKSDQSYTGGTDITAGAFMLATKQHPMGVGDGTQNVTVRAGATLQIGNQVSSTGCVYNYVDLAGTIRVSGTAEGDAWNTANFWHNAISLAADARIEGGWFWLGHNQLVRTLALNGHTLTLHLTTGESYLTYLETDSTGGKIVVDAGSIQVWGTDNFSAALEFQGAAYAFLGGDLIVKDFKYATNKWRTHGSATQVLVSGTYHAGLNRPPMQLQDGAILDLSEQTGSWSTAGQAATAGANNRTFTTPGQVTFAPGATVRVEVGERELVAGLKLVQWTTAPGEDVSFELTPPRDGVSLDHNEYELFVSIDTEPVIGVWTGAGDPANPADPANWACTNKLGQAVEGRLPVQQTHVVLPEGGTFNFPATAAIVCKDVQLPATLGGDSDLSGLVGPCVGTIDLQGHSLTMSQLAGQVTITDTSTGTPGEFHVNVSAGSTVNNTTYALTGNLRLVKDGAGTLVVSKPNQSYLGGTEVAAGMLQLGTNQNPMGTGDGSKDVTVRAGATIDINRCYSSTTGIYNYLDLAGTIRISGTKEGDAWNTAYCWHNVISLAADARIEGGWFYLGHNQLTRTLSLNDHTLTLHLTTGEAFVANVVADSTGGQLIVDAGSLQGNTLDDFSLVDVEFQNAAYIFLSGQGVPVKDFKYAVNKWRTHAGATQVFVYGTYHVGLNRPPVLLQNGATLDLSEQTDCWTADGQAPVTGDNNRTFTTPGKVSFEPGGQIVVDLGTREFFQNERVKVVAWSAAPEGTTFRLTPERMKDLKLIANGEGLWVYREGGLVVIIR